MTSRLFLVWALASVLMIPGLARAQQGASAAPLKCDHGPLTRTFGGAPWLVYACSDGRSLAIISAPGSAAMPFYFFGSPEQGGGKYRFSGEGTGNKAITDTAFKELGVLSLSEINALIAQANEAGARARK